MRPLKLKIEGFNSFYRPAEIDFERLGAGGVFGIFGKTGSGKSTIVESLVFALYGALKTKLNLSDCINRRLARAEVTLEFAVRDAADAERRYRVKRVLSGKTVAQRAELWDITEETVGLASKTDDVNAKVRDLLGLSAQEFRSCIVLEQNEYDRFVNADPAERKRTVGALFGLLKYGPELRARIKERTDALKLKQSETEGKIGATDVTEEEVDRLRAEWEKARESVRSCRERALELTRLREAGRADFEAYAKYRDDAMRLDELTELFAREEARARETEIAVRTSRETFAKIEQNAATAIEEIERSKGKLLAHTDVDDRILAIRRKIGEYEERIRSASYAKDEAAADARTARSELDRRLDNKRRGIERLLAAGVIVPNAGLPTEDGEEIALSQAVGDVCHEYRARADRYAQYVTEYTAASVRRDGAKEAIENGRKDAEEARQELAVRERSAAEAEQASVLARQKLQSVQRAEAAAQVRANLHEGDVCPVCGGIVRETAVAESPDTETALREAERTEDACKAAQERCASQRISLARLDAAGLANVQAYETALREVEEIEKKRAALGLGEDCGTVAEELDRISQGFARLAREIGGYREKLRAAERTVITADRDIESATREREEEQKKLDAETALRVELVGTAGSVSAAVEACDARKTEIVRMRDDARATMTRAEETRRESELAFTQIRAERDAIAGRVGTARVTRFDADAYRELCERAETASEAERSATAAEAAAETTFRAKEKRLADLREFQKELAAIERKTALHERLAKLTRGDAMMEWLAEEYIQEFTAAASEKLAFLTGGDMELRYVDQNFVIVDNFNDGKERKVATVSGGETFLVALSLAISIAAKLEERAGAGRMEFFFIDEGFGTLSPEKIDAVMEALRSLVRDDFTVGLISHVTEMQSSVGARLFVERDNPEEGSLIRCD